MAKRLADALTEVLCAVGLADESTRRVVIDLQVGQVPVVYTEKYGDHEELIQVIEALATVEVKKQ